MSEIGKIPGVKSTKFYLRFEFGVMEALEVGAADALALKEPTPMFRFSAWSSVGQVQSVRIRNAETLVWRWTMGMYGGGTSPTPSSTRQQILLLPLHCCQSDPKRPAAC
jgi:hypothetical protein